MRQSSPRVGMSDQTIDNLTRALEGEYAATYAYGLIGARVSGAAQVRADKRSLPIGKRDEVRFDLAALQAPSLHPQPPTTPTGPSTHLRRQLPSRADRVATCRELGGCRNYRGRCIPRPCRAPLPGCATRATSWGSPSQTFPG